MLVYVCVENNNLSNNIGYWKMNTCENNVELKCSLNLEHLGFRFSEIDGFCIGSWP